MMQEQHKEQVNQVKEINKAALDMARQSMQEMAAQMTALMATAGNRYEQPNPADENANPNIDKRRGGKKAFTFKGPKKEMHPYGQEKLCKTCKKVVRHFERDCFSLEANKSTRPDKWKAAKK